MSLPIGGRLPYMKFFPRDWLSSRAVALMTLEQRGAYVQLLCHAWLSAEPGVLLADDLPALSGLGADGFMSSKAALARAFDTVSRPGFWIQKRAVSEAQAVGQASWLRSQIGRKGAAARWRPRNESDAQGNAKAMPTHGILRSQKSDTEESTRTRARRFRGGSLEAERLLEDLEKVERERNED